jgi:NAD dependent epimerase/dehydratase family enzyme
MSRILLSGASGVIGSVLARSLAVSQNQVTRLVRRRATSAQELDWAPEKAVSPELVSRLDAVMDLAGEPIAARWSDQHKRRIRDSRVLGTENLARAVARG